MPNLRRTDEPYRDHLKCHVPRPRWPVVFEEAARRFAQLKSQFQAGQLEAALHELMVKHEGVFWTLGAGPGDYISELQRAIELDLTHGGAHIQLEVALYERDEDAETAKADLLEAWRLAPKNVWPHYQLGEIYHQEGPAPLAIDRVECTLNSTRGESDGDTESTYRAITPGLATKSVGFCRVFAGAATKEAQRQTKI